MNAVLKWVIRMSLLILGALGLYFGGGVAHADAPDPAQPIPGMVLPPEFTALADQANGALQQAQTDMAAAGQQL